MSDGRHDATLDHRRASGATPWERFWAPSADDGAHRWQTEPPVKHQEGDTEKGGSHTDGAVSVANLIAKIGAPTADRPSHHRVTDEADEAAPDAEPREDAPDRPIDQQDTQVIDAPADALELASEFPDLGPATYPNDDADRRTSPPRTRHPKPNAAAGRCCWPRARWRHYSPCWRWPSPAVPGNGVSQRTTA